MLPLFALVPFHRKGGELMLQGSPNACEIDPAASFEDVPLSGRLGRRLRDASLVGNDLAIVWQRARSDEFDLATEPRDVVERNCDCLSQGRIQSHRFGHQGHGVPLSRARDYEAQSPEFRMLSSDLGDLL